MNAVSNTTDFSWGLTFPEDIYFRRICLIVLAAFLIASLAIPYISLPQVAPKKDPASTERIVRLLLEKKKPQPVQQKKELSEQEKEALRKAEEERRKRLEEARKKSEEERKKLEEEARKRAELDKKKLEEQQRKNQDQQKLDEQRKLAEQERRREEDLRRQAEAEQRRVAKEKERGAEAAKNIFGDVQDLSSAPISAAATDKQLKSGKAAQGSSDGTPRADVLSQRSGNASKASGGIDTGALSGRPGAGGKNDNLAERNTTQVGAIDMGEGGATSTDNKKSGSKVAGGRNDIPLILQKIKGSLDLMYNRARRTNPALSGKVVVEITIDPSGQVTGCRILSSELNDPELEAKIIAKIKTVDFGVAQVETLKYEWPLDFVP